MEKDAGSNATFVVHVQFCKNSSWQGTVSWMEQKKEQRFRSALELLKLMDEALTTDQVESSFVIWN